MQRTQETEILGASSSRADSTQDIVRDKEGHNEQEGICTAREGEAKMGLRVELDGCFHKHAASRPVQ